MPVKKVQKQNNLRWILVIAAVQCICAAFFVSEFLTEVLGLRRWALPFAWREVLQILASLGLVLGTISSVLLFRRTRLHLRDTQRQLRAASGAFFEVMAEFFDDWALSPSERDVAMFAIRGFNNIEIAELRGKSEATIKTQMNAVFRKSGVSSRMQLMAVFVDALISATPLGPTNGRT